MIVINYKSKWLEAKATNDELIEEIAKLKAENKQLRIENESLWIENKQVLTVKDKMFEAGCIIAKDVVKLRDENLKLKIRLDVVSKKGVSKDAVQK